MPEKILNEFMKTWREKDFFKMENYIQKTWLDGPKTMDLKEVFGIINVKSWKILKSVKVGQACKDMIVNVIFNKSNKRKLRIRMICETAPYTPDLAGDWGVNPISVLRRL